ncbi:MAG: hypothetical protein ACFFG0_19060 [Candidatus Thorarchaeota archaeon]
MLSIEGWFEGIFTVGILIVGLCSGLFFIYKSRKTKAKLLLYMGFLIFTCSLTYLGVSLDFFAILLTGNNIDNSNGFQALMTYLWTPPIVVIAIIIGAEITIKKNKILFLSIFAILGLIYEIIIFLNPFSSLISINNVVPSVSLIHTNIIFGTSLFFIMGFFMISIVIFVDLSLFLRGIKSEGIIRKKYFMLALGFITYQIITSFDAFSYPGVFLIIIRGSIFVCFLIWYLALKEELIKPKKRLPKKKVKIEDSLFLLSEIKPGEITEEEVIFFREQKICLVCKGEVKGFNYICSECDALYCENCARTLSNLENACWVCNIPFDNTKPSKPFTKNGEDSHTKKPNDFKK